jgi:hypothetical protein
MVNLEPKNLIVYLFTQLSSKSKKTLNIVYRPYVSGPIIFENESPARGAGRPQTRPGVNKHIKDRPHLGRAVAWPGLDFKFVNAISC